MLNAIRALRILTDEEYTFVLDSVTRAPIPRVEPKTNGALTGKAPKGSSLASERAKKAWRTRKRNEKKRNQGEAGSGEAGRSDQNAPAAN